MADRVQTNRRGAWSAFPRSKKPSRCCVSAPHPLGQIEETVTDFGKRNAEARQQIDALVRNLDSLSTKLASAKEDTGQLADRMGAAESRMTNFIIESRMLSRR